MYAIGEFSKITGLSIKTLRFYHEKSLLVPTHVETGSGYRYYDAGNVEKARVVVALRDLGFSLQQIAALLEQYDDDSEILDYLQQQLDTMQQRIARNQETARKLRTIVSQEQNARAMMKNSTFDVQEKAVDEMLIAGIRMQGKYSDCGKAFGRIGRSFGRHICGKALLLHYDTEYKEEDADFEACMPVRQGQAVEGVSVRTLAGGRCVSLLHQGPYDELGRSYEKILAYMKQQGIAVHAPCREVYIKGPGMIFRGNPKNYLTEIQFMVEPGGDAAS